jgi:ribosomal protein S18 acetylase RimI-like enzyme
VTTPTALAAAVNSHSLATVGTRRSLVDERGALRLARYVPESVAWSVDGHGAAYVTTSPPAHVVHELGVFGGSRRLLEWAESEARGQLARAPRGVRVVAQSQVLEADRPTRRLLEDAGYEVVRTWSHLEVALSEPPASAMWPEGISVRHLDQAREWPVVGAAMDEAFADHWGALPFETDEAEEAADEGDEGADDPYSNSRDFCFVAWAADEVAGVLLGNERTVEWPASGKIGSVSVRRPFRRQGLATALLLHALGSFHLHGITRVITDTDAESFTAGPSLYEQVGMREYRTELVYEKELRPGRELRALIPE